MYLFSARIWFPPDLHSSNIHLFNEVSILITTKNNENIDTIVSDNAWNNLPKTYDPLLVEIDPLVSGAH